MSDDELLDVLDPAGRPVAPKARRLVHRDHDWHGLVFVWCAWRADDGTQRMVLQQRGRTGDPFARQVDALAGGHIGAGEDPRQAACRELAEEAGLQARAAAFVPLATTRMERPTGDCRRVVQHLLLYPVAQSLEDLRFSDEVDGFVEVELKPFADLVHGRRTSLPARARYRERGGGVESVTLPRAAVTDYPEAILDTFRRSLAAISGWLRTGRVDPASFADAGA